MEDYRFTVIRACYKAVYGKDEKEDFIEEEIRTFCTIYDYVMAWELSQKLAEVLVPRIRCLEDSQIQDVLKEVYEADSKSPDQGNIRQRAARGKEFMAKRMGQIFKDPKLLKDTIKEARFLEKHWEHTQKRKRVSDEQGPVL